MKFISKIIDVISTTIIEDKDIISLFVDELMSLLLVYEQKMNKFLIETSKKKFQMKIYQKKDKFFFQKLDLKGDVRMVEVMNNLLLQVGDKANQLRVNIEKYY